MTAPAPTPTETCLLLERIAAQDRAAFRSLYHEAGPKLMGVLVRILGTRSEAEDALQEVFTRVWLRAGRFDPSRGAGMTWLVALSRNHAIDRLRARKPEQNDDDAAALIADTAPRAEVRLIAKGEARRVSECFDTLEPARADAVRGAYLDGLSYDALALRHNIPLNTMRTWLRRSLLKLRECLEQ
ncbi:sigma-70 family RNA polymerase sigma factor [Pseudotabrizicola sediminis]|uniref:Sigma-70 family RNA polymerase sigma factor n=1 Tax=Pseudotabrizicola sediminis TaxID=2486418 RepID=A0ABY2KRX5_9RHOB|nr:sigma-70 family RNA polymerase sigma factor [Pseudotabrizicola sediminis]TGD45060.1 sigma-70 family RNA polymerase sigma factor [Pseudotabrizicola sediminis]TGD65005.1 sigma-70 family RNA polymerase sigma factor [Tabrizicola sp. WMC-M-20]